MTRYIEGPEFRQFERQWLKEVKGGTTKQLFLVWLQQHGVGLSQSLVIDLLNDRTRRVCEQELDHYSWLE
jgi:hypothetical protein